MQRAVTVNWVHRPGDSRPETATCNVGWANLPPEILQSAVIWTETKNEQTITEEGAIGLIALLIHELENAKIKRVVPIDRGGDYYLELQDLTETQVECSGVKVDMHGNETR
jgi:hypothetical protein